MHYPRSVVYLMLALLVSIGALPQPPAAAQGGAQGVVRGQVFRDTQRNFLFDPGEAVVVGARVELWQTTSFSGQPLRLQVSQTNAQGQFQFVVNPINGPLPDFGCYEVRLTLPPDLGGGVTRSQEICRVTAGGVAEMDFALPGGGPPVGTQSRIQGTVFRDANGNRQQDANEPAVGGAVVELWQTTSITGQPLRLQVTQTNVQGQYQFTVNPINGPAPNFGCYEVRLTLPPTIGGTARSQPICQVPGGVALVLNFAVPGAINPPPGTGQGTIQGTVYRDVNGNRQRDAGEAAVIGSLVELWQTTSISGQPLRLQTTQTDAQGRYQFVVSALSGPRPDFGCYEVRLTLPPDLGGGVARSQQICQVPAGALVTLNFSLPGGPPPGTGQAAIQGTVFRDTNGNRQRDAGEAAVAGAVVELWHTTSIAGQPLRIRSTQTNAQGQYRLPVDQLLNGPLPDFGCYEVRVILPQNIGGTARSPEICQIGAGAVVVANFAIPGGTPPPTGPNQAPVAIFLRAETLGVRPGGVVRIEALAVDPNNDCLTYQWVIQAGAISNPEGPLIDWIAPNQPGNYLIRAIATDSRGATVQGQIQIQVTPAEIQFNRSPSVQDISATDLTPALGQFVRLGLQGVSDPDRDALTNRFYIFGARGARASASEILWQAFQPGLYTVHGIVFDNRGGVGWARQDLSVNSAQTLNRAHASYGSAGQLLIEFGGHMLWVGINNPAVAQQAAALTASGAQRFVLGRVVPDRSQRYCFFLDPNTVSLAEITAEGIQTTIEQVSRRPEHFAPGGGGGFDTWALSARLIEFVPAR